MKVQISQFSQSYTFSVCSTRKDGHNSFFSRVASDNSRRCEVIVKQQHLNTSTVLPCFHIQLALVRAESRLSCRTLPFIILYSCSLMLWLLNFQVFSVRLPACRQNTEYWRQGCWIRLLIANLFRTPLKRKQSLAVWVSIYIYSKKSMLF